MPPDELGDLERNPEWQEWTRHVREEVIPKIDASAIAISLVPRGKPDVKYAVELGLSILMEKPIILLVRPGTVVPRKLRQIADGVIEADMDDPRASEHVAERIERIVKTLKATADDG